MFRRVGQVLLGFGFACLVAFNSLGFSLLGPYEPWMQPSNSFRLPGDIGGPMPMDSEYRWNVPVISYGFDASFMDYFGENGSNAVLAAIQMINDLPPASEIVLSNFSTETASVNFSAQPQGLWDLKSATMTLLLEQLGLTQPTRNTFILRQWHQSFMQFPSQSDWGEWVYESFVCLRNYDPVLMSASYSVNEVLYTAFCYRNEQRMDVVEVLIDPLAYSYTAVAEGLNHGGEYGHFYTGFTRDDVGGLRFLLSSNNINFETLLPDVHGSGPNAGSWVSGAWRRGVEKITFVPHACGVSSWLPMTNQFTDNFQTNGAWVSQQLERITAAPDIVFSAGNNGVGQPYSLLAKRTDASNWINNAVANGNTNGSGPGVIPPPIAITFHKRGAWFGSTSAGAGYFYPNGWGSFDTMTNGFIAYPVNTYSSSNELHVNFTMKSGTVVVAPITWVASLPIGGVALLQQSTNLTSWITLGTVTNTGAVLDWSHTRSASREYFRVLPQ